jgi:hypothetical protein
MTVALMPELLHVYRKPVEILVLVGIQALGVDGKSMQVF